MDLQYLVYFSHLAKTNHLTKTAEELRISQPSLTQYIKRLEAELGVSLFDRRGRNIRLNPYGEIFLEYVDPILDLMEQAQSRITDAKNLAANSVMIYAPPAIYVELSALAQAELPKLMLNCHPYAPVGELQKKLLMGELDLCIQPAAFDMPGLAYEELLSDNRVLVLSAGLYEQHPGRTLADFADVCFVAYDASQAAGIEFQRVCEVNKIHPKVKYVGSLYEMIEHVRMGMCAALVPERILARYRAADLVKIAMNDSELNANLRLYWNKSAKKRMAVTVLKQLIMEHFGKEQK